jgi:hypothetical protein
MIDLTIELTYDDAAKLLRAFNEGKLPSVVTGVRFSAERCHHCGATPAETKACEYASEINGDETPCTCCDSCRHACCEEI